MSEPMFVEVKCNDVRDAHWRFKCGKSEETALLLMFLESEWREGFNITMKCGEGDPGVRFYAIPWHKVAETVLAIMSTEGENRIASVKRVSSIKSYVIMMHFPVSRVSGAYRFLDDTLVRMSESEEQVFLRQGGSSK